jgi:hypothetical protein
MPVPTHRRSCVSKAYPIVCNHCKQKVFIFSCTCNSIVFFNELGGNWEKHDCEEYRLIRQIYSITNLDKLSFKRIFETIVAVKTNNGEEFEEDTLRDDIEYLIGKRKSKETITKVQPFQLTTVTGKVISLDNKINIFKRLGYVESNEIAKKLLESSIGKNEWASAKIRTAPDRDNNRLEFEVIIPTKDSKPNPPFTVNDNIIGIVEPVKHSMGTVWKLIKHEKN